MEKDFTVRKEGTTITVKLGEQLTTSNAPALREELETYRGGNIEKVVFDATRTDYIASTGIRTIIFAKQELGENPTIVFVNCSADVRSIFEMTGLQDYLTFITE